ncbi:MAG: alpha/beta hydrolase [Roseiflexaceae bacterium]|nr:alpha/beta hydrolase [Roseiflexus sp.]MDW8212805.1 alpha/beta hydrolase [Roseiflexaceae bacterium]
MTALTLRAIPAARRASALYCATSGGGFPLLFIHGFGASGDVFQPLASRLASRYQTIVPDLRGHGRSRRLPLADSIERMAADVGDLLDLLRVDRTFVIGHAGGSAVAAHLAADQPTRVCGLVLISPPEITSPDRRSFGARLRDGLSAAFSRNDHAGDHDAQACQRLLQKADYRSRLRSIVAPTLVIAGDHDPTPTLRQAREIARSVSNGASATVRGGGASLLSNHADALIAVLAPWLEQQERAA